MKRTPNFITTTASLINYFLADNGPTPQVSLGPEGGVAIDWLVNGRSMTIHVISETDIRVWADDANGQEVFDLELNANWKPSAGSLDEVKAWLKILGDEVDTRFSATA